MTLCTAWLRRVNNNTELIFATDSCLSAGERWDTGIKLFDFNRKDCLICFAGHTYRAYPLIMNAKHLVMSDSTLSNPNTSLHIVKDALLNLFTELTDKIYNLPSGENIEETKGLASFLFGGWDYLNSCFKIWHIYYYQENKKFLAEEIFFDDSRPAFFIGDNISVAAESLFKILRDNKNTDDVKLEMEPFSVLTRISLDDKYDSIAGPVQLAKVYRSGSSEFFGVIWPSSKGKPTLHGQEYSHHSKPFVKYIDSDSAAIIQEELPDSISNLNPKYTSKHKEFIEACYTENIRELNDLDRERLINIFKELSYSASLNNEILFLPMETAATEERNG